MAWIELHQARQRHPKTLHLARLIKKDRRYTCGLLDDLWTWALDIAERDGLLPGLTGEDIAVALDFPASKGKWLVGALVESGYIDVCGGSVYQLHDWQEYAGKLHDQRKDTKERVARYRARKKDESVTQRNALHTVTSDVTDMRCNASTVPNPTVPNPTVPNPTVPNPTVPRDITDLSIMPPCSSSTDAPARGDGLSGYFSSNLKHMSAGNYDELRQFLADGISEDVARFAVDTATAAGKPTWGFTRYLLNQWLTSEVKTIGDAKAYEQRRAESIKTSAKPNPALTYEQRPIAGNGDELFTDLSAYGKGGST